MCRSELYRQICGSDQWSEWVEHKSTAKWWDDIVPGRIMSLKLLVDDGDGICNKFFAIVTLKADLNFFFLTTRLDSSANVSKWVVKFRIDFSPCSVPIFRSIFNFHMNSVKFSHRLSDEQDFPVVQVWFTNDLPIDLNSKKRDLARTFVQFSFII